MSGSPPQTQIPAADEVEVSLFGHGLGEIADLLSISRQRRCSAVPSSGKFRYPDRTVEKTMQEAARKLTVIPHSSGHVCMRGRNGEDPATWKVTCHGAACHLDPMTEEWQQR